MTAPQRPDTPLGDLIAGKIDQATYRRRMAARAPQRPPWDPDPRFVAGPEPVRRVPVDADDSGMSTRRVETMLLLGLGVLIGFIVGQALLLAAGAR